MTVGTRHMLSIPKLGTMVGLRNDQAALNENQGQGCTTELRKDEDLTIKRSIILCNLYIHLSYT